MKENIQMLLTLCLFAYIVFLKQCSPEQRPTEPYHPVMDTIIRIDTILPPPVYVQLPKQEIPPPKIVYIDSSKNIVLSPSLDSAKHETAQLYKDSLDNEDLTIYYESLVQGKLLDKVIGYKLKVPKQITKTIEIPKPYPMPINMLLLTGGIGGNFNQFSNITAGLQFVSRKGWSVGYEYDFLKNTHQVKVGIRLFQFAKKR